MNTSLARIAAVGFWLRRVLPSQKPKTTGPMANPGQNYAQAELTIETRDHRCAGGTISDSCRRARTPANCNADGETLTVKPSYTVSGVGITFKHPSKPTTVLKGEIAGIYKIAVKSLKASGESPAQELGPRIIFDPQLYAYGLHLEGYIPVLLYSADEPEGNSSVQCRGNPFP